MSTRRVIAATNRKLPDLIRAGMLRQDLYYRLNVFPVTLPPLRDRPEDTPLLVWAFVKEFSKRMGKPITRVRKKDLDAYQTYDWPGNVRELRNVVERSMILAHGPELSLVASDDGSVETPKGSRLLREVEKTHILEVLESTGWKIHGPRGGGSGVGAQAIHLVFAHGTPGNRSQRLSTGKFARVSISPGSLRIIRSLPSCQALRSTASCHSPARSRHRRRVPVFQPSHLCSRAAMPDIAARQIIPRRLARSVDMSARCVSKSQCRTHP